MSTGSSAAYRPNVGIVVFNRDGLVWLGRRVHTPAPHNWQFPQGGVDKGEELLKAARRELQEETGIVSVSLLAATSDPITYDFPPEHRRSKATQGYRGQSQTWFAFRFDGDDAEVDLQAHPHVEFEDWRWTTLEEAHAQVIPFKRDAYARVISAFGHLPDLVRGGPPPE